MSDIAFLWDNQAAAPDIAMDGGQLAMDDGLRTAILISLFTDARAAPDDALPEDNADRRGWWGNAYPAITTPRSYELGSRLWLLDRAKTVEQVLAQAKSFAREALQWLLDDAIVTSIEIEAERQTYRGQEVLALGVIVTRPQGPARQRYDFVLEASA